MLTTQSVDGRISLAGIRNVRETVIIGGQVQRADVAAIITTHLELLAEAAEAMAIVKRIREFHDAWGESDRDDLDQFALWEDLGRLLSGKPAGAERVSL